MVTVKGQGTQQQQEEKKRKEREAKEKKRRETEEKQSVTSGQKKVVNNKEVSRKEFEQEQGKQSFDPNRSELLKQAKRDKGFITPQDVQKDVVVGATQEEGQDILSGQRERLIEQIANPINLDPAQAQNELLTGGGDESVSNRVTSAFGGGITTLEDGTQVRGGGFPLPIFGPIKGVKDLGVLSNKVKLGQTQKNVKGANDAAKAKQLKNLGIGVGGTVLIGLGVQKITDINGPKIDTYRSSIETISSGFTQDVEAAKLAGPNGVGRAISTLEEDLATIDRLESEIQQAAIANVQFRGGDDHEDLMQRIRKARKEGLKTLEEYGRIINTAQEEINYEDYYRYTSETYGAGVIPKNG